VAAFLDSSPQFAPLGRQALLDRLPTSLGHLINDAGRLRSWPWQHALEAFFGAAMIRR
jgi:hypothetical protein